MGKMGPKISYFIMRLSLSGFSRTVGEKWSLSYMILPP